MWNVSTVVGVSPPRRFPCSEARRAMGLLLHRRHDDFIHWEPLHRRCPFAARIVIRVLAAISVLIGGYMIGIYLLSRLGETDLAGAAGAALVVAALLLLLE
jgi:hypothetical protein